MDSSRKHSKKRDAILSCLRGRSDHPSADQVFHSLKPLLPELSLGTVYRNLGILVQDGLISSAGPVNGQERYEARTDPHSHFVCRRCSRMLDLELPDLIKELYGEIENTLGCIPECHTLTITGLCPDCAGKQNEDIFEVTMQKEATVMKKWVCSVCGHVHEGEAPPELCPVCKVTSSNFRDADELRREAPEELFPEDIDEKKLHEHPVRESRKWVCTVCGHVHEGPTPPELCPVCKVPASDFRDAAAIRHEDAYKEEFFSEDIDEKKLHEHPHKPIRKWVCTVCGHVHEGPNPPELCPVCKVPASDFRAAE